jgi:hypothetical protein
MVLLVDDGIAMIERTENRALYLDPPFAFASLCPHPSAYPFFHDIPY